MATSTFHPRRLLLAPLAGVLALALAPPSGADAVEFSIRTLTQPAKQGLAVTGPLSDLVLTSTARVMVPNTWQRRHADPGQLRFTTTQNPSCRYTLTYTVTSMLAPSRDVGEYVAAELPSPSPRHLLDSGERGSRAFRVVRQAGLGGRVRLDALWIGVLTRRADVAPSGQTAWTHIRVSAISGKDDECHAGTWRQALGPTIGDSLAVARTRLRFTKKH
jgi:hypothetical protein